MIDFNRHVKVTFSVFKEVAFNKNLKICINKAFWKFQKKKKKILVSCFVASFLHKKHYENKKTHVLL